MRKKVSLIVNSPYFSFTGANSAVANYLNCVKLELEKSGCDVHTFPVSENDSPASINVLKPSGNILKKALRQFPAFYNTLSLRKYLNQQKSAEKKIIQQAGDSDLIIEFLTIGSRISSKLCDKNKKYILIFDAPAGLQYVEMYKAKSFLHGRIGNAEMISLKNADQIVCYSEAVKKYLQDRGVQAPIAVIPCLIWKERLERKTQSGKTVIGFIGSFLSWHKVELLIHAFNQIAPSFPNSELILVGFGEEWHKMKKLAEDSPFNNRITLTGYVSEQKLEEIKSFIDIGVMPGSNWYGSPLKLFEYAESGIPIIAPSTPTVTEYFKHNENALIIDPETPLTSLVGHLKELIENKEKRENLGEAGYKMMQTDFAKDRVMSKFVNLVKDVLKNE